MIKSIKFIKNDNQEILDVLLHGGKGGTDQSLNLKIFDACVSLGHSVASFSFPFFERGEEQSSGPELTEEISTLKAILSYCESNKFKHIRLIGKSLGGIIAGKFLSQLTKESQEKYSVVIFGYVTGDINLNNFNGKIRIIQGEKDKYGNIEVVKNDLRNAISKDINYFEIKDADHSYRNELKEPVFENEAINIFKRL